jgi:hypothetical protein
LNGQADIIVVEDRKQLEKILSIKDQIPTLKAIVQYTARRRSHHRQLTYAAPSSLFFLPYHFLMCSVDRKRKSCALIYYLSSFFPLSGRN